MSKKLDSFNTKTVIEAGEQSFHYHSLPTFEKSSGSNISSLPFSLKILLENLLRKEDGIAVQKEDVLAMANWDAKAKPSKEIQFTPSRIILQDFTGVPAVADLAAMRGAIKKLGGDPAKINPLQPADLVIDHSVQVDHFGTDDAEKKNSDIEFQRNNERYEFLRWGQTAFKNFRVVPPSTGIVHQVNLEYLAQVAFSTDLDGEKWVYPDSLVGTDSHTTMINGLGVVGWGVGGIEAEAAMLGQPITMLIPNVIGFKLTGKGQTGVTATDLVLTIVQKLREKGVVGKFVEFYGPGLENLTLADRATIANMAPEYGATIGIFPVDGQTTNYLNLTGRTNEATLVEAYFKAQGLWYDPNTPDPTYSDTLSLDLGTVEPSLAGPSRPQDRVPLSHADSAFQEVLPKLFKGGAANLKKDAAIPVEQDGGKFDLHHGSVVIAAITSCTNTSNPSVLIGAGLLAKNAVEKGLKTRPWVKTSLAPGSKVVTDYLKSAGLLNYLEELKFNVVGYGCTTCIGNSGPLSDPITSGINDGNLVVSSVLSGNRNFEGRISPHVRSNYLASPPLVVAYALAGNMNINITKDPLGEDKEGKPVYLKDIWPKSDEIAAITKKTITSEAYKKGYADVFSGSDAWKAIKAPKGDLYKWEDSSTYIKEPPFFDGMSKTPEPKTSIKNARVLALLQDSVTTDHISPAGSIQPTSPAGQYLQKCGVNHKDFNSFGSRRGNHEVMIRGTFGNVRIKNQLAPGTEGGVTRHLPDGKETSIYEASEQYQSDGVPLIVLGGKEYGTGSSRDWAAKGTLLLGVKAVIVESFERIHRSNLVGMGVLPLQFLSGDTYQKLGITGEEEFDIEGIESITPSAELNVIATASDGKKTEFKVMARIDTPNELEYYKHGGILQYVLRQVL